MTAPRALTERASEVKKSLFLCFIDYSKGFVKVKHDEIIETLQDINAGGEFLRIILERRKKKPNIH